MKFSLDCYQDLVFDCDGVVLNSNGVKTNAFFRAAQPFGEGVASALVKYHIDNGGVSRYRKFEYLLSELIPQRGNGPSMDELLSCYASEVCQGLIECELAPGLVELREKTMGARWLIVSGGDQDELREIFARREIAHLFDGGIFGSPDTKDEILSRKLAGGDIKQPALFIGDSRYDYVAANNAGLDFCFVSKWTEFHGWENFCRKNAITHYESISDLLDFTCQ